jgi:hypothetical protein
MIIAERQLPHNLLRYLVCGLNGYAWGLTRPSKDLVSGVPDPDLRLSKARQHAGLTSCPGIGIA